VDAANAVQNEQGKVISKAQTLAEQKLANFDKYHTWVDANLGRSAAQKQDFLKATASKAEEAAAYNFNKRSIS
jgi:hypothetical protein